MLKIQLFTKLVFLHFRESIFFFKIMIGCKKLLEKQKSKTNKKIANNHTLTEITMVKMMKVLIFLLYLLYA